MSDNDLIRRGDALAAVQGFGYGWHAEEVIAALPAALSRCPYGASGDDCCGGYCSMDDDKKGGDACDKDDDPANARPATSPGVTAGADAAQARPTATVSDDGGIRVMRGDAASVIEAAKILRDKLLVLVPLERTDAAQAREAAARLLLDMLYMRNGAHEGVSKENAQAMWDAASTREGYAAVDAFLRSIISEARKGAAK